MPKVLQCNRSFIVSLHGNDSKEERERECVCVCVKIKSVQCTRSHSIAETKETKNTH